MSTSIPTYFRTVMREKGIKQTYLAQKTGFTEDAISKFLCGRRRVTADAFLRICDALDIDPNVFRTEASNGK